MISRPGMLRRGAAALAVLGSLAAPELGFGVEAGVMPPVTVPDPGLRAAAVGSTAGASTAALSGDAAASSHRVLEQPASEPVVIHDNTTGPGTDWYRGQAGQQAIDDIHATGSGHLRRISFEYVEPSPLAPGLEAMVTVYDNPWGLDIDLVPLAGPYVVTGLLPGRHLAQLEIFEPVEAGPDLWIGVQFNRRTTGLVINDVPSVGASHDYYLENGSFFFFGGDPKANFSIRVEVGEPVRTLHLDILPAGCPNPINVSKRGETPAAILGDATVNVLQIDRASIRLEGVAPTRSALEDVATPAGEGECACTIAEMDGFGDLTLKFDTRELVRALGAVSPGEVRVLRLAGSFVDGTPFVAQDCIVVRGLSGEPVTVPTILIVLSVPSDVVQEFEYELAGPSPVELTVYDVTGRVVKEIVGEEQPAGLHQARWDASDAPGGVYFCRLRLEGATESRKLLLIR